MITKEYIEKLVAKNALFIDDDGVAWDIDIQYYDGNTILIFTCCCDNEYEFLHVVGGDISTKNLDGSLTLHGADLQNTGQNTLIGKFYIEVTLD